MKQKSGAVDWIGFIPADFTQMPNSHFLVVANQRTDNDTITSIAKLRLDLFNELLFRESTKPQAKLKNFLKPFHHAMTYATIKFSVRAGSGNIGYGLFGFMI